MNQKVEIQQVCYYFGEEKNPNEDKILFIQEETPEGTQWEVLAKGWEYNLWYTFGERGGLAEAGALLLKNGEDIQECSIESYVKRCKDTVINALPVVDLFDKFNIEVHAWTDIEHVESYIVKEIEKYALIKQMVSEERVYYSKEITTVEDLKMIPFIWESKNYSIKMIVKEK